MDNKPNLLYKTRFYLIGAMENASDCGMNWRVEIMEKLKDLNINWFDPLHKHFVKDIQETKDKQDELRILRAKGDYEAVAKALKEIRNYDLSMVDRSDALIFYFDSKVLTCGTWEEFFHAISIRRPIFVIAKNGLDSIPFWMFGCLPYKYFYSSLDEAVKVLKDIDAGIKDADSNRWRLLKPEYR